MHIRTERYVIFDSALNSPQHYWNQSLYPLWAPLSTLVGRRDLVETVHFTAGLLLLLPLPLAIGVLTSRAFVVNSPGRAPPTA